MKAFGLIAAWCLALGFSNTVNAEVFTTVNDPTGEPMCFDDSGAKAPLAACDESPFPVFVSHSDPTGAAMCFSSSGNKAPLARCAGEDAAELAQVKEAPEAPAKITSIDVLVSFFQ